MGFALNDLSEIEPSTGGGGSFELLPIGDYRLQADEISEEKATSKGDGKYVTAKFAVVEGPHEGVSFFVNFNIDNPNPKAMEIAWRELSAWGHAVGVLTGDSDALLYKPFMARVGIEESTNPKYPADKNKIMKYYRQDEKPTAMPTAVRTTPVVAPTARPAAVAAAPAGARPWPTTRRA